MPITGFPLRIVQLSDIHCGEVTFDAGFVERTIENVNSMSPDLVVIAGDLTAAGYQWEFEEAAAYLERIQAPKIVIPGNHDSRNVGYIHFQRLFGDRFPTMRIEFEPERAERVRATGVTVVGVDSSEPDLNEGKVGREHYQWIREQYTHPGDVKIFVVHHHLVSVPGAGRERNIVTDAGDLLAELTAAGVDIVLCGHKHVPYFWGLNGMLICNSGTVATKRLRGLTPPSWNELEVDATTIKVFLHYWDGRRELSCIRSRTTREVIREAFMLTEDFLDSNKMLAH
ncbi:MAG TPA: metallophosphoesterase [Actinomycetota bacterium]|jgi:3',5'-cyclic-AMP phosphodiesterase|nr:metallophosphoesterase [Actinomycetota bacterium]